MDKNSKIDIDGALFIDSKNDGQFWYYSNIRLKENSILRINGEVNIFSGMNIKLFNGSKLEINDGTYFSGPITIHSKKNIRIGKNCSISWNCTIIDSNFHKVDNDRDITTEDIIIEDNVWIGNNVTILPGSFIGNNTIVATGSIVNGILNSDSIYAGNPCKLIRKRR